MAETRTTSDSTDIPQPQPKPAHSWPMDGSHLFGKWSTLTKKEEYRKCVHPNCHHYETRPYAKA